MYICIYIYIHTYIHIDVKLKGKVLRSCVTLVRYGLETVALTEQQQQKLHCRQTSKESRGRKTSVTQEKATAEMGGLREEEYKKIE